MLMVFLSFVIGLKAQPEPMHLKKETREQFKVCWTLENCIKYAQENSIEIQQSQLKVEDSELALNTSQLSRLPNLNANLGGGAYFGRSPSQSGVYGDNNSMSGNFGVSTSIPIYEGGRISHQVASRKLNLEASQKDKEAMSENIILNIAGLYLNVLFKGELVEVGESQLELSKEQVKRSKALFESGKSPESDLYESESLVARDESTLTQYVNDLRLSVLDLIQAMNLEYSDDFQIYKPTFDSIELFELMNPEDVYNTALESRPLIEAEAIRLKSKQSDILMAKSSYYPSLSLTAGYGTNLFHNFKNGFMNKPAWEQLGNNSSGNLGLSLNIPIYNRNVTRNSVKSAELALQNQQLYLQNTQRQLRKDIERAYASAQAAYGKYLSSQKALKAAELAFEYEVTKSESGRSTIFDFNDTKTRLEKAKSDLVQSKFEYIFKTKMLQFYVNGAVSL